MLEVLKAFLDVDNSKVLPSYEEAAATLQVSVGAVKTLIHRLREQYAVLVREEVERTVSDPGDVDAEIHELCEALVSRRRMGRAVNTRSRERQEDLMAREIRACKVCGTNFSATEENEFCPVCMLRRALASGVESSESFSEDAANSSPKGAAQRLEHYELVRDKDRQPMELGRVRWVSPTRRSTSICVAR